MSFLHDLANIVHHYTQHGPSQNQPPQQSGGLAAPHLTPQQLVHAGTPVAPKSMSNPTFSFYPTHMPIQNNTENWTFAGTNPIPMPHVQTGTPIHIPLQNGGVGTDYLSRDPNLYVHGYRPNTPIIRSF